MSADLVTAEEWAASLTPAQVEGIIVRSVQAYDWKGVEAALRLLARKDPARAELLYAALRVVIAARVTGQEE